MNRKGRVGSMAPTSPPAVSYLSFQGALCQRQQRDQVSRTGSDSSGSVLRLFLHPEIKPQQSHVSTSSWRFSHRSCGHCWQCPSPDSAAGEDLASCLSLRNLLHPGLTNPRADIYRWGLFSPGLLVYFDRLPPSYLTSQTIRPCFLVSLAVGS